MMSLQNDINVFQLLLNVFQQDIPGSHFFFMAMQVNQIYSNSKKARSEPKLVSELIAMTLCCYILHNFFPLAAKVNQIFQISDCSPMCQLHVIFPFLD